MITLISNLVTNILVPIILISTILSIVSNISKEIDVSKIGAVLRKSAMFVLELMLIIFVGILSLEGSLAANVDGIVAKTTKSIVSTTIPVVGKLIGDATDSVIGATSIAKNAVRIYRGINNCFYMYNTTYKIINSDGDF
jgi:stage III sporulation protein AE